jgi:hypothetical protein
MQPRSEPERFVFCSDHIALQCRCGEVLILLGLEEDWHSERTVFKCQCGQGLTLADRLAVELLTPGEELTVRELLRSLGVRDRN